MGQSFKYNCTNCNYSVMTSAGLDYGFIAVVDTYTCLKCRIIVDVSVGLHGKVISKEELEIHPEKNNPDLDFYKCPVCGNDSALVKWNKRKRPCPKCDGRIVIDPKGESLLWD